MLQKPSDCSGCALRELSSGFMRPSLAKGGYKVALLGEALGEDEADQGAPFVGKAGFKLTRLIEWAGFDRSKFDIYNTVWCRPPFNRLEGQPYEDPAIAHCKAAHWGRLLSRADVVVPMGNVPTNALLGRKGILSIRGYVWPGVNQHVIPTVHPSFIQRGQAKYSAAFINDIQKAVLLARGGMPPQITQYLLDPSPAEAYSWAKRYREAHASGYAPYLAFDIETPGKPDEEDEADTDSDAPDRTWNIERIGFAFHPLEAISFPWAPEYTPAIRLLLEGPGHKVVWNAGFDVPRIRRTGVEIGGTIHDGMVAWHILHTDLPKSLRFVATFTCPWQPAWKHLSGSRPAFYNATDADVELRSMIRIEEELKKVDLWGVYEKDVLDLEPILIHMHAKGMPIDEQVRLDRAIKLAERINETQRAMEDAVPLGARRIEHVYKNEPRDTTGLQSRRGVRTVRRCSICGQERPRKDHFKRFVKKLNPCAEGHVSEREEECREWFRLAEFTPSRDQLIRYHTLLKRPMPMVWDKKAGKRKISFGERQIKDLLAKYPDDVLYSLILQYRELDKLAGTYIGRPSA